MSEYYISIDVETDGPCPGVNSMLQFGAVFYQADGTVLAEYKANLFELEGAVQDPDTMKWWAEQEQKRPGTWASMTKDRIKPETAMAQFQNIVKEQCKKLGAKPVCVAYPAGFDFTWLYWYLCRFNGRSCVGFSALDMKTLGMALMKTDFTGSAKRTFPKEWFNPKLKHTHNALDDAREQGYTFVKMFAAAQSV